ncbi:NCS2 family permease [Murimonas intestini]|uniref:AGZA family xanthine/uracil permease-like MFS transporter n=1 Tax=Murimonas intestini TaxID=1337051 RepID=A0AB73T434_9FIRM|nr:NCS2 family permease [Murimonas intestini]MCR1840878.1 NCS2 family permease [Murimonas intestini]MCR1866003.1 NCS2 family permease [Murimonas intestini]MCR1883423.1 NCS2 family permease [Murimonas intestini]
MKQWLEKRFKLSEFHTNVRTELLAGLTTFVTMAYVLATVPNMMESAGLNKHVMFTVLILLVILTTCAMAFYTNRPFALAPGLGSVGIVTAMIANDGISPEIAAGVIFWSGVLFIAISFLGLREAVVKVIPVSLKHAVSAGIGLFIALLGAKSCGLIIANEAKKSLGFGDLTAPTVIVAVIGFVILLILKSRKVPGDMIIAIALTTLVGIPFGVTKLPESLFTMPANIGEQFMRIDFTGALNFAYIPFLIALFVPDFFSTFGTVLGVGAKAGYLDKDGNLPGIDKCFKVDAVATSFGALFGMPSMTTYLESSAGVEAGGKTGLTVIFTSVFFALALILAPVALMIPSAATAPVLMYIGINMLGAMKNIRFDDMTEAFPAFVCIAFTIFGNNIANGICAALPVYVIMKIASGKIKEIRPVMWILVAVCLLYFYSII